MSADDSQYSTRLPPIGFEQIEEEVKPLKKKKKKKSKLKHIALATQGFTQGKCCEKVVIGGWAHIEPIHIYFFSETSLALITIHRDSC